jgi:glycerol uptake facilitator-like aquaporin/protein-tyrosine-phosphatase
VRVSTPGRRLVAEGVGTALLLAAVVGSGIMGERLSGGNGAIALLANSLATGAALVALILAFGPVSGAHFNPAVTLALACRRETAWKDVPGYVAVQGIGALVGVWAAHYMFEVPVLQASRHIRTGGPQWAAEVIATFGLLAVIFGAKGRAAYAVGGYITAAYWFTSSTSFANPAVTFARAWTDTFAGIRPADVPAFMIAQMIGAVLAAALFRRQEDSMKTVLFACVHNAGRSQMSAALFNLVADPAKARAISAGTEPGPRVHPEVLEAMKELGVDLSNVKPQKLTAELASTASLLVTMGCGETCPVVPGLAKEDWPLEDPKGKPVARVREIRDDIRVRVSNLARDLDCARIS